MWVNFKILQFDGPLNYAPAFFQNLLSKVISINNIYNSIMSKQQNGDSAGIYFDLARLTRILIDFNPIESSPFSMEELERMYNKTMREMNDDDY